MAKFKKIQNKNNYMI